MYNILDVICFFVVPVDKNKIYFPVAIVLSTAFNLIKSNSEFWYRQ